LKRGEGYIAFDLIERKKTFEYIGRLKEEMIYWVP
jgi:hypothetical protein